MNAVPSFRSYGEYSSSNYGANSMQFDLPNGIRFYYSYSTLVAFLTPESGLIVHKNDWSTTTGKHLNWIDGGSVEARKRRVDSQRFNECLEHWMKHYGLEEEKCLVCGDALYTRIRGHHHHRADCKELHDCATDATCKGVKQ